VGARVVSAVVFLGLALATSGCGAKKFAKQGESLLAEGRTTHAARAYGKACEKRPSKASFQLGHARALIADGQADRAVPAARKAVEGEQDGAELVLIDALIRTGQTDEARQRIDRLLKADPSDAELHELSAREMLVAGKPRGAVVAMKKVIELDPTGPRVASMAWLFARANEMPRALEAAEQAVETGTTDLEALGDVAAVFMLAERDQQRKDAVREIQSYSAEALERWTGRAGRAQKVGDHEGALRALTIAVAMRPNDGELLGLLGQMQLAVGAHERAILFLERALQSDDYRASWEQANAFDTANAVHTMGFENEAAAAFCRTLSQAHLAAGHKAQAANAMRASMLIGGDKTAARWVEVGRLFADAGDGRGAAHAGQTAYQIAPRDPGVLVFLMQLYANMGDAHQAVGFGRMAWQSAPGDPMVALTLGELYERRGEFDSALELYTIALREHPDVGALRAAMKRVGGR